MHIAAQHDGPDTAGDADLDQGSVLDLILARVRLRARRRAAWLGTLWGGEQAEPNQHSVALALDDRDTPEAEAAWYARADEGQVLTAQLMRVENALEDEAGEPLRHLSGLFRLAPSEVDLLQT